MPPRHLVSTPAFASYIEAYQVPGHRPLNAKLLEIIMGWRAKDEGIQSSNQLGWHSPRDLMHRKEPAFQLLRRFIGEALTHSIHRYWHDFDPAQHRIVWEGWANVNGKGAFNAPHGHVDYHLSGSYYVTAPTASARGGAIEFLNPAGALSPVLEFGRRMVDPHIRVLPKAGQLLIFPSYLRHWVYPNHEDSDRVSIAFNVRVLGSASR